MPHSLISKRLTRHTRHTRSQPPPSPSPRLPTSPTWLDLLPTDLCARIASHLTLRQADKPSLLRLASLSQKQSYAVLDAFNFSLNLSEHDAVQLAKLFSSHVRTITLGWICVRQALPLLRAHSLINATLSNRPSYLNAVARAINLKKLVVEIVDVTPATTLLNTLAKLTLTSLAMRCGLRCPWRVESCLFRGLFRDTGYEAFGMACQNLVELELGCTCRRGVSDVDLEPFLKVLVSVKVLIVDRQIPHSVLHKVAAMEAVWLKNFRRGSAEAVREAVKLGAVVKGILTAGMEEERYRGVTAADAAELWQCTRLEELELHIEGGVEKVLPRLARLKLHWVGGDEHYVADDMFWNSLHGMKRLCLYGVRVRLELLRRVLEKLGELEELGISTDLDREEVHWRVLVILQMASGLKDLKKLWLVCANAVLYRHRKEWRRGLEEIQVAFAVLGKRCRELDLEGVRRCLFNTLCCAEVFLW